MDKVYLKIQLKLLDKYYPYTCKRSEEENIRKAAVILTEKFLAYSSHYTSLEKDELLTLIGFHFALKVLNDENKRDKLPILNKIENLNKELEKYTKNS
ncbi:MAG: cell division protein ZapA [Bacteroidales bacterium OttesenSCG-928-I14]|jgi:cell division protein ZapA|nr:cell division protein ZapA [Bacteroidales bacterium OttesenSCG-928-I14]